METLAERMQFKDIADLKSLSGVNGEDVSVMAGAGMSVNTNGNGSVRTTTTEDRALFATGDKVKHLLAAEKVIPPKEQPTAKVSSNLTATFSEVLLKSNKAPTVDLAASFERPVPQLIGQVLRTMTETPIPNPPHDDESRDVTNLSPSSGISNDSPVDRARVGVKGINLSLTAYKTEETEDDVSVQSMVSAMSDSSAFGEVS